MNNHYS